MKIAFNFGTQKNVDPILLASIISQIIKENTSGKFDGLKAGAGTLYINLYDNEGVMQEIVTTEGKIIDYMIRGEPYKRRQKNMSEAIPFGHKDDDGEFVADAYLYEKYT